MVPLFWLGVLIPVLVLGGILLILALLRALKRRKAAILAQFSDEEIVLATSANLFGQQSRGHAQVRGNGQLFLLVDRLQFELYVPRRTYEVPLAKITRVSTPTRFLHKTRFKPLLRVDFTSPTGAPDAIAWAVRDLEAWVTELRVRRE